MTRTNTGGVGGKPKVDLRRYLVAGITAFLVIACSIIFYFCFDRIVGLRSFFGQVFRALMPVIYGVAIAYVLSPVYNCIHRHIYARLIQKHTDKTSKRIAKASGITASLMLFLGIVYALFAMIVPNLIDSLVNIWENSGEYINEIRIWISKLLTDYPETQADVMNAYNGLVSSAIGKINDTFGKDGFSADALRSMFTELGSVISNVSAGVRRIITFFKNIGIGLIVAAYVLAMKKRFLAQSKKMLYAICSQRVANVVVDQFHYANKVFSGFISGKLLDSLIIGILCFIGCSILHIPYALLVSVVIGITNIIPFFGPFIGAVPSALLILLIDPIKCFWFIIFIFVLQQFDGNILGPKILGSSTGISSFWVIFSLLLFGGLFGVPGMILGVPLFGVIYHMVDTACSALLVRRGLSTKTEDYILLNKVEDGSYVKDEDPAYPHTAAPESGSAAENESTDSK